MADKLLWFDLASLTSNIDASEVRDVAAVRNQLRDDIDALLDNVLMGMVVHTVTAGEAAANQVDIDTGYGSVPTGPVLVQVRSAAGICKSGSDEVITLLAAPDAGTVRIANGGAVFALAADDVVHLIAIP